MSQLTTDLLRELAQRMREHRARFEKLGYCDAVVGIRQLGEGGRAWRLAFEVYECTAVDEVPEEALREFDFVLEADEALWDEMFDAIRSHGGADAPHTINTLSHLGDRMKVTYEDPEGHDKLYRYMATLQAFFDLAAEGKTASQKGDSA